MGHDSDMILIRFPNETSKDRALELLIGEHPIKSWQTGELLIPEEASLLLARNNIPFVFEGVEAYDRFSPLRNLTPATVQWRDACSVGNAAVDAA